MLLLVSGAQYQASRRPEILNFVRWRLKYVDFSVLDVFYVD
jgi:hypothetical protein